LFCYLSVGLFIDICALFKCNYSSNASIMQMLNQSGIHVNQTVADKRLRNSFENDGTATLNLEPGALFKCDYHAHTFIT
jgi:hypothetical protein